MADTITIKVLTDPMGDEIAVQSPYKYRQVCEAIPNGVWNAYRRAWCYPANPSTAKRIHDAFTGSHVYADETFHRLLETRRAPQPRATIAAESLPRTKTVPWTHQVQGVRLIERQTGTMLAWDMGTGKTKAVIDAIAHLGCRLTLIVCPKSVISVWPAEFVRHSAIEVLVRTYTEGTVAKKTAAARLDVELARVRRQPIVLIINYESAWRSPFGAFILSQAWDMIVCDEIHRIKSPTGRASRFMQRAAMAARKRVGLSGTPMPHSPLDAFAQYRCLDVRIFGTFFTRFRNRYAVMGGYSPKGDGRGVEVLGYQNLDELQEKWGSIAHQVRKEDVLDLPPVVHQTRYVELGPAAMKAYASLERHFVAEVDAGTVTAANALVKLLRLQQVTGGFLRIDREETEKAFQDTEIGTEKADALEELLGDLPDSESVVVFCKFHHDIDMVLGVAEKLGRPAYEMSGRRNELRKWQNEGGIFAVQIKSGGVGVDLTRAAYCVYYSLGFSLGDYQQSLARLDRPGQTRSVTYIHLVARGTIDERVYKALEQREHVIDSILNGIGDRECVTRPKQLTG